MNKYNQWKKDRKYKKAGQGNAVGSSDDPPKKAEASSAPSPARAAERRDDAPTPAGNAALARFEAQQKKEDTKRSRQLNAVSDDLFICPMCGFDAVNHRALTSHVGSCAKKNRLTSPKSAAPKEALEPTVTFKCPLCLSISNLTECRKHIPLCVQLKFDTEPDNPVWALALILGSGAPKENIEVARNTLKKYVSNIITHPGEDKYKRVRVGNKAYQERVAPIHGTKEFMLSIGFVEIVDEGASGDESFLVFIGEEASLPMAMEALDDDSVLPAPLLNEDAKVFGPSDSPARFDIPWDFSVASSDIKRTMHEAEAHKRLNQQVMTKEMRQQALTGGRTYRYCLIRARFPSGIILQGSFRATTSTTELHDFIRNSLAVPCDFALVTHPDRQTIPNKEEVTLAQAMLVPATLLNFEAADGDPHVALRDDLMDRMESL